MIALNKKGDISMNGTIIIKAEETLEGTHVGVETHLNRVNFKDKCMLVRCLCKALELTSHELVFCAAMMDAGVLNCDQETMFDLEKILKAKENIDGE